MKLGNSRKLIFPMNPLFVSLYAELSQSGNSRAEAGEVQFDETWR